MPRLEDEGSNAPLSALVWLHVRFLINEASVYPLLNLIFKTFLFRGVGFIKDYGRCCHKRLQRVKSI